MRYCSVRRCELPVLPPSPPTLQYHAGLEPNLRYNEIQHEKISADRRCTFLSPVTVPQSIPLLNYFSCNFFFKISVIGSQADRFDVLPSSTGEFDELNGVLQWCNCHGIKSNSTLTPKTSEILPYSEFHELKYA